MAQAHVSAILSGWERLTHVIVSAQTYTVSTAKLTMTPLCALSANQGTISEKTVTVMNASVMNVTSSSNPSPNLVPVKLASTGTAHVAVVIVVTTALTVVLKDPNIVARVS